MRRLFSLLLSAVFLFALTGTVRAHPGHPHPEPEVDEFDDEAVLSAATHPFTGVDHVLAMLAAGLLASVADRRLGAGFVGAMGLGFAVGYAPAGWLPALAAAAAGFLLLGGSPSPNAGLWALVAVIGFWLGGAHAARMGGFSSGLGLCLGTAIGVWLGAGAASGLKFLSPLGTRVAGGAVLTTGLLLAGARLFPA